MNRRGVYRGGYSALVDDLDFQRLSATARHALLTMRWSKEIGIACVWLLERDRLSVRMGVPRLEVDTALLELGASPTKPRPWMYFDGDLCWLRNGLRYDPTVNLANPKHKEGVMRQISALPRSPLIVRFCRYYDLPNPFASHPLTKT
jgi:hypothetical protein